MARRKRSKYTRAADNFLGGLDGELRLDGVPFVNMFQENPLGILVAVVMLFMMVAFFESNLPGNPFAAFTDWTGGVWTPFYNFTNYYVTFAFAFFPFALLMGVMVKQEREQQASGGGGIGPLAALNARIKKPTFKRDFVSSGKRNPAANVPKGPGLARKPVEEGLRTGAYGRAISSERGKLFGIGPGEEAGR